MGEIGPVARAERAERAAKDLGRALRTLVTEAKAMNLTIEGEWNASDWEADEAIEHAEAALTTHQAFL